MVSQVQTMTMKTTFDAAEADSFSAMFLDTLMSVRLELMMFVAAVAGYLLLFSYRIPKDVKRLKLKAKLAVPKEYQEPDEPESIPQNFEAIDAAMRRAVETGDHRAVFRCWNSLKQINQSQTPSVRLSQIVESMTVLKKDSQHIARELSSFFKKHPAECDIVRINEILESLGKRLDSQLMSLILDMLPSLGLKQNQQTYEIFLTMHATTRSFPELTRLVSEMEASGIAFSTRATVALMKAALQTGNFADAHRHFMDLKKNRDQQAGSCWEVPRHIMAQFVDVACKNDQVSQLLPDLKDVPVPEEAVNEMLSHCISSADCETARTVEALARAQQDPLPDSTYSLLIKGLEGRPWRVKAVVEEVLKRDTTEVSADLAISVLAFCSNSANAGIADRLLELMKPKQLNVLTAFIRYYVESEQPQKACDVFEQYVQPLGVNDSQRRLMIDARVERSLMSAALNCGRTSLIQNLFDSSRTDVAKHIVMIRKCASENNLQAAMSIFESLKSGGAELNSIVYNTVLDACVKCNDLRAAEKWMTQMQEAGVVDVVSYNTLIKAHLMHGNFPKARAAMEDMKKEGLQPNRVTFNELINAAVTRGSQRSDIWDLVKEMKQAEVPPNQVTCSILLKSLNAKSNETDILLTMDLIDTIDEQMDEVLLSSVVEACVRIGKPELLAKKLEKLQGSDRIAVQGSHTYGSLIKAHGHAKDLEGVWRCWKEMRSRHLKPTSITLGCMIEAVVNNGDAEGAFELIHQMEQDDQCRECVNSVIYCSVLKGFARERKIERVWNVYEEMCKKRIEVSLITFNTIIDACARAWKMENLSKVLQDMKKYNVEPNIVTYSTIIKGYCQSGDIQKGFAILEEMKHDTNLKPDEIMYNSLLDGCAQNNLFDEGLALLDEMQKQGVTPSNFTLSIMVKMLNRARKIEEAFDLVKDMSQKYKFKPNVHVYTNLIQGCIASRQQSRTLKVLETMVKDRVYPDGRTYAILVRASIFQNNHEQAAALLRASLGLPGALELPDVKLPACYSIEHASVNEALERLVDAGFGTSLAAPLLADIKKFKVKVNIDQATQRRVAIGKPSDESSRALQGSAKGKGKGKSGKGGW